MGYIRHHAIVVTSSDNDMLKIAHEKANELFEATVSNIVEGKMYECSSFFVGPDGSKEGWDESVDGDNRRTEFIEWINEHASHGINSLSYAELYYGNDEGNAAILRHN